MSINKGKSKKVLKIVGITLITIILITVALLGGIFIKTKPFIEECKKVAYDKLATVGEDTFRLKENTLIMDNKGGILKEIKSNNYKYVEVSKVSKYLQNGYIAVEDRNFLDHNGIDLKGLMRAGVTLIKNDGEVTQGGSTITQQVIKNMLLSQERTFKRKVVELYLAPEIERKYSKADIMEFYVNTNYYGNGCYGVYSASKYYFGKTPDKLNPSESAILIGLSNNPSKFDPVRNESVAKDKRDRVLLQMREEGYLNEDDYIKAKNSSINLVLDKKLTDGKEDYLTSYAIHSTVLKLMELDGFEFKYGIIDTKEYDEYREVYLDEYDAKASIVRAGGFTIHTSLDRDKQAILQENIDNELKGFEGKDKETGKYLLQGAGVLVNNNNGMVEAIVGGRGTDDNFNRGYLAYRQPGSALKPLVAYGVAFDRGDYYPSLILEDREIPKGPRNVYSGYLGNVSIREAISRSINTIPYRMLLNIGTEEGIEYLAKMKFDSLTPKDNVGSLALGGVTKGVRLVDMAKAYSTIATDGVYKDTNCIQVIEYTTEGVIYDGKPKTQRVYTTDTSYMLIDTLKGVLNDDYGTGRKYKLTDTEMESFGKTGTTNSNKDNYFCGVTPDYSLSVWVGYDMPKPIENIGEGYAGNIWKNTMDKIGGSKKVFDKPDTIVEKFVDTKGKPTSGNTGVVDIFSDIALSKLSEKREEEERERLETIERRWKEIDKERQVQIESDIRDYEMLVYKSTTDLDTFSKRYNELKTTIGTVEDISKREEFETRVELKKQKLDKESKVWVDLKAKERNDDLLLIEQKAEQDELAKKKGEGKAESLLIGEALKGIEDLKRLTPQNSSKYYIIATVEDKVERCIGYGDYDKLLSDLQKEKLRLTGGDTVRPQTPQQDMDSTTNIIR